MNKNYKETYFQHDRYARRDAKIKSMLMHFRKESEDKAKAAVCVFWWIVEDMHIDDYPADKLDVFADDYRCDVDFLKTILEDFELFRIENGCYVSDRVIRNLREQQEKSEKAKKSAAKRWKNKDELPKEKLTEKDIEFVDKVIEIFNKEFDREQIVSTETKEKINGITKKDKLTLSIWQKVFENAKRGWDIGDKQNVQPCLKNILAEWDSFASGDYNLAPDRTAKKAAKAQKEKEIEQAKERERLEEIEARKEMEKKKEAICDAASAIDYINNVLRTPTASLKTSNVIKQYAEKYNFTVEDILKARENEQ